MAGANIRRTAPSAADVNKGRNMLRPYINYLTSMIYLLQSDEARLDPSR